MVSASGGNFSKNEQLLLISNRVCFIEVRGELTKDGSDAWKSAGGILIVSVYFQPGESGQLPSSSSGSEARTAPLSMESGTSWGSRRGGQGPRRSDCAHPNGCHFSFEPVFSCCEGEKRPHSPQAEKFLRPEPSWPPLSRTSAYPPSDHPSCECFCPSFTL